MFLLVGLFIMSNFTPNVIENFLDLVWLKGMIFAFIMVYFCIYIHQALHRGSELFRMSDVNFLFVSPVNPGSILLYGIFRMMGMTFLMVIFILYQGYNLRMWFGIEFWEIFIIFAGFILAVSLIQIISLLIYSLTNANAKRKMIARIIIIVMFLPMIVTGIYQFFQTGGDLIKTAEALLRSPAAAWTPVVGWASEGIVAFIAGNFPAGFFFLSLLITAGIILVVYILVSNPDYYEDVLVATETAFEKKRAITQGINNLEAMSDKKVKISSTGVGGAGASVFFYKHLRESFRANILGLWGIQSVLTVAGAVVLTFLMRTKSTFNILVIMQILMWAQVFMIGTGRGVKEIYNHFIYMIPESSFKKIIWSNLEIVIKVLVESLFIFGITGIILQASPPIVVSAIIVYTLFSLLLIGINIASLRWTDTNISAGIMVILYLLIVMIVMLPGVIAAIIVGSMIEGWGVLAGMAILAAWELLAAAGFFALSQGILHDCDLPVIKIGANN
jgi:hypothetical protein